MNKIAQALRVLGEETRLRILVLVSRTPLNVSELTTILGMAQSGISRHLSHLRKIGLLQEQRDGVWTYYQLAQKEAVDDDLGQLWDYLQAQLASLPDPYSDLVRLEEVLRHRRQGSSGLNERLLEPGQSWYAWSRLLSVLIESTPLSAQAWVSGLELADLGCGDGSLTVEMARFAQRVVGVDFSPEALSAARQRVERLGLSNIELLSCDVSALSLPTASLDVVVFSQSLHHLKDPHSALQEASRVLKHGGRLLIMELAEHQEHWVQEKLNHQWLGFQEQSLISMLECSGLHLLHSETISQRREELFQVLLVCGLKPEPPRAAPSA
jgi:SAM-dependent methyltransferase